MKKLFLSLVALVSATMSFAQSSLIATLSHDGEISTFYGNSALREAHEAAQHGDIITLSSGSFTSVNITKAVTIRGAGMKVDTIAKTNPTFITGNFDIQIPDNVEQRLTIEGLLHNDIMYLKCKLNNATFLKNKFNKIESTSNAANQMINSTFIHCIIKDYYILANNCSGSFVNCFINSPQNYDSSYEFTNCIICQIGSIYSSTLNNCILYDSGYEGWSQGIGSYGGRKLASSNSAFYCLGRNNNNTIFANLDNNTTNHSYSDISTIFKTFKGTYSDGETFELTDEAKAKYLGSDGTEVGIYGGALPFNPTPTNPQITKCNVASKSTADGKLSVDIEVSATE